MGNRKTIRRINKLFTDMLIILLISAFVLSLIANIVAIVHITECDSKMKSIEDHMVDIDEIDKNTDKKINDAIDKYDNKPKPNRGADIDRTLPMLIPSIDTSFKAYMSYKAVTAMNSTQYKYRLMATTDEQGFRRIGEDYVVAMGTYYAGQCGERFHIELSSGKSFNVIIGDIKSDMHTNDTHQYIQHNGNMIEFLVDINTINDKSRITGDMSYSDMDGNITTINKII